MNETFTALVNLLAEESTQRQKLETLEHWTDRLTALSDEELAGCLRLIQSKINSKKIVANRDKLVGALRRDALPPGAKLPKPSEPQFEVLAQPVASDFLGRGLESFNLELEGLIASDPRSKDNQLVYRDWLEEQGLVENGRVSLGAMAAHKQLLDKEEWRNGFLTSCCLRGPAKKDFSLATALECLLDTPGPGRFLETLRVSLGHDAERSRGTLEVIGAYPRYCLQTLHVDATYSCSGYYTVVDSSQMWSALPRLRELTLHAASMMLGDIDLPELRKCTIIAGALDHGAATSISNARWPKLETLLVSCGHNAAGATNDASVLRPLLNSQEMPRLRTLSITDCDFTDELCADLAQSALLAQLEILDLSNGTIGSIGAQALLTKRENFTHLRRLNLDDNFIPAEFLMPLRNLCSEVVSYDQNDDGGAPESRDAIRYHSAFE